MSKMQIVLDNVGKKYQKEWIFRHCSYTFESGNAYAITGSNGSGKSTLLQCIAGSLFIQEGSINYQMNDDVLESSVAYQQIAIAAPYLELIEEMTATEFLSFHCTFKPFISNKTVQEVLDEVELAKAAHKQIRYYSSGMKQRLKLAQAIFSDTPILLLDEPCTNLDVAGYNLYQRLINLYKQARIVIICSNEEAEYNFCNHKLSVADYKL